MDQILVITPSMPTDISLAAVAKFVGCKVKTFTTEELRKPDLENMISNFLSENVFVRLKKIILTGPYWSTFPDTVSIGFEILAGPGSTTEPNKIIIPVIKLLNTKQIHTDLVKLVCENTPNFIESTLNNNRRLFELLDARYNCDTNQILETEALFAGLSNFVEFKYDAITSEKILVTKMDSLFLTVQNILLGQLTFDQVFNIGLRIFKAHIALSLDRAEKNSHAITLKDGTLAVITCASDLINLTHEQLHKKYPTTNVTVTTALQFQKDNTTALSLSVRTYPGTTVSVKTIVEEINGSVGYTAMGSDIDNATGGRIKFPEFNEVLTRANFLKEKET